MTVERPAGWLGTPSGASWPGPGTLHGDDPNPFVRFRHLLWAHGAALGNGMDDDAYVAMVRRLDDAVAEVDGAGFATTPLRPHPDLAAAVGVGSLLAKDETGNVSGTHKARHLFGLALHLEATGVPMDTPLAIASCGNAALGHDGMRLAFTCQGTDNLLTLDGGRTLGLELAEQLVDDADLYVQVGGGALASSCVQALGDAVALGVLPRRPRLLTVQTEGCAPLKRAFDRGVESGDPFADVNMWPWNEPSSLATGILDDVVYDWQPLVATMLEDGTQPLVATEAEIAEAHRLVRAHTDVPAAPPGPAGVAGVLAARREDALDATRAAVVLLTGVER